MIHVSRPEWSVTRYRVSLVNAHGTVFIGVGDLMGACRLKVLPKRFLEESEVFHGQQYVPANVCEAHAELLLKDHDNETCVLVTKLARWAQMKMGHADKPMNATFRAA